MLSDDEQRRHVAGEKEMEEKLLRDDGNNEFVRRREAGRIFEACGWLAITTTLLNIVSTTRFL